MTTAEEIRKLEIKFKKISITKEYICVANKIMLLFFVFLLLILSQIGVFKKGKIENISKILEMFALFFCLIVLALLIAENTYIKILKRKIENAHGNQNKQSTKERKIENIASYLTILGGIISLLAELIAVTNQYHNFGFDTMHGNFPLNINGIIDISVGIINLVALSIIFSIKLQKYDEAKKKYKQDDTSRVEFNKIRNDTILLSVVAIISVISIVGKLISSLESTCTFAVNRNKDTIFPLGMMIRSLALISSIVVTIVVIKMMYKFHEKELGTMQKDNFDKEDLQVNNKDNENVLLDSSNYRANNKQGTKLR